MGMPGSLCTGHAKLLYLNILAEREALFLSLAFLQWQNRVAETRQSGGERCREALAASVKRLSLGYVVYNRIKKTTNITKALCNSPNATLKDAIDCFIRVPEKDKLLERLNRENFSPTQQYLKLAGCHLRPRDLYTNLALATEIQDFRNYVYISEQLYKCFTANSEHGTEQYSKVKGMSTYSKLLIY